MLPLISIIIPTYNRAQIIEKTLQSVLDQTYQDWECIIVDDISTDDTDKLLEVWVDKDARFKYYKRHRSPKGAPTCRNIGQEKARGEYVIFLDSDDLLERFCLANRVRVLEKHPKIDLLISNQIIIENEKKKCLVNISKDIPDFLRFFTLFGDEDIPWILGFTVRKDFLKKHSISWKEDLKLFQDIQFNLEVLSRKPYSLWLDGRPDCFWVKNRLNRNMGNRPENLLQKEMDILNVYESFICLQTFEESLRQSLKAQFIYMLFHFSCKIINSNKVENVSKLIPFLREKKYFSSFSITLIKLMNFAKNRIKISFLRRFIYYKIYYYLNSKHKSLIQEGLFQKVPLNMIGLH